MTQLIKISWRGIPAQVIAKQGRKKVKVVLSDRFQKAIDRAAMKAGRMGSEEYLDDWQRTYQDCIGDLEELANAEAERLESHYSDDRLEQLVKNRGVDSMKD